MRLSRRIQGEGVYSAPSVVVLLGAWGSACRGKLEGEAREKTWLLGYCVHVQGMRPSAGCSFGGKGF